MDLLSTSQLFSDFLAQRRYLRNVTPSTIEWYVMAFKALQRTHGVEPPLTLTARVRRGPAATRGEAHLLQ